jgi:hypothetical protein
MSWITAAETDSSSNQSALGDLILAQIRRALVLVGVARSSDDRASAHRAFREAYAIQQAVLDLHAGASLHGPQDARVRRGLEFLARSLQP